MLIKHLPVLPAFGFEIKNCNADKLRAKIWETRLTNIAHTVMRIAYSNPKIQNDFRKKVMDEFETSFEEKKPELIEQIKRQGRERIEEHIGTEGTNFLTGLISNVLQGAKHLGITSRNPTQITDDIIEKQIQAKKQEAIAGINTLMSDTTSPEFKAQLHSAAKGFVKAHLANVCTAMKVLSTINKIVGYIPVLSFFAGANQLIELGAMSIIDPVTAAWSDNAAPDVKHKKAHIWSAVIKLAGLGCALPLLDITLTAKRALADPRTPIGSESFLAL